MKILSELQALHRMTSSLQPQRLRLSMQIDIIIILAFKILLQQ